MQNRILHCKPKSLAILAWLVLSSLILVPCEGRADLRTPSWFDPDGVGSGDDWHYRVPMDIPAGAFSRSTIRVDVDFSALLTQMGVSGTFDPNSPRVVRSNGALANIQQFADAVYGGTTDALNNGRGEIRFLIQDSGPVTYYLYFDILANGAKPVWNVNNTINGNFEFSVDGQQDPPQWNGRSWSSYDAFAIIDELNRTVTDNSVAPSLSVNTDEVARSGQYCYLIGARNTDEASSQDPASRLTRRIAVPGSNPGVLRFRYRIKGWDSSADGANQWDFLRAFLIIPGPDLQIIGPAAGNYTTNPYSPNLGLNQASPTNSGYGQYNGWDTDTNGNHLSGMTINPGTEPWFDISVDLSPYAGQNIRLRFETRNSTQYKSWFHIDDVEWSVVDVALDPLQAQALGVNIVAPNDTSSLPATIYNDGDTLVIQAQVDADPTAATNPVTADLIDPNSTLIAAGLVLFNDGTHGDALANDAFWTNDGSVPADPTYTFLTTDFPGTTWTVVVYAKDGSTSTVGAPHGLIHIQGQPNTPYRQANYYNIDDQVFTLITPPNISMTKTVVTESDPINGSSNPKAIPGATILYTVTARNQGGTGTDNDSVFVSDPVPANTDLYVGDLCADLGEACSGPMVFIDGSTSSGLTYTFGGLGDPFDDIGFSNTGGPPFNYTPVPDARGYDANVTNIQINPKGVFNGVSGLNVPEFTLRFRVRVQ